MRIKSYRLSPHVRKVCVLTLVGGLIWSVANANLGQTKWIQGNEGGGQFILGKKYGLHTYHLIHSDLNFNRSFESIPFLTNSRKKSNLLVWLSRPQVGLSNHFGLLIGFDSDGLKCPQPGDRTFRVKGQLDLVYRF